MTSLVQDHLSGSPKRAPAAPRVKTPWRRVWQIPLLVAGALIFAWGVRALVSTIQPIPFDTQAQGVENLIAAGKFPQAIDQINTLGDYFKAPREQSRLQTLAGDAHYLAQQQQPLLLRVNYQRVEDHYRKAVLLGAIPTARMNQRWGQAALALGDTSLGIEKLEAAIAVEPAILKVYAKDLVTAYQSTGGSRPIERAAAITRAQTVLTRLLAGENDLTDDERAWALCKKIELAILRNTITAGADGQALQQTVAEARQAMARIEDRDPTGRVLTWIGRAELENGAVHEAEADLSDARTRFAVHHMDDGRAAVLLGKIAEVKGDLEGAAALFAEVITEHAGTSIWAAARLGRAEVAALQDASTDKIKADYQFVVKALADASDAEHAPELVSRAALAQSLIDQYQRAARARHWEDALLFLTLQQSMGDRETPALAHRLATSREARADELMTEADKADEKARSAGETQAREMYAQAAEDYLRHSKLTTLEDAESGNSLWKAAELFDKAGNTMRSIGVYEQFTVTRPRDPRVPEGLLATGRLYQSAGMLDQAIAVYRRTISENPKTPAAYAATVSLARCYMAQGEAADDKPGATTAKEWFDKAEQALLSLVQESGDLRPEASEFRISLLTLGDLYYRNGRWADAILRLQECAQRYPDDKGMPRTLFMLGESYRHSALEIGEAIVKDPGVANRDALEKARADRLGEAAGLLGRVIGILDVEANEGPPAGSAAPIKRTALEEEYLRAAYLDRAECCFVRGDYPTAIKLYDQIAARFASEVLAVQAYVQIVNAYMALGESTQASAAAERGRWVLKRIPDEAFGRGAVGLGRDYYERLLALGKN